MFQTTFKNFESFNFCNFKNLFLYNTQINWKIKKKIEYPTRYTCNTCYCKILLNILSVYLYSFKHNKYIWINNKDDSQHIIKEELSLSLLRGQRNVYFTRIGETGWTGCTYPLVMFRKKDIHILWTTQTYDICIFKKCIIWTIFRSFILN